MHRPRPRSGPALLIGVSLALALLHACQDASEMTEVDATAAAVTRSLTVIGSGTGDGTVRSSPAGINCTVTDGKAAATGCSAPFNRGATVTLTATPKTGHSLRGWFRACTGTGTGTTAMVMVGP